MMLRASAGPGRRMAACAGGRVRPCSANRLAPTGVADGDSHFDGQKKQKKQQPARHHHGASLSTFATCTPAAPRNTRNRNDRLQSFQQRRMMSSWVPWRRQLPNDAKGGGDEAATASSPSSSPSSLESATMDGGADFATSADTGTTVSFGADAMAVVPAEEAATTASGEVVETAAAAGAVRQGLPWEPDWYWPPDMVIDWLNFMAGATDLPYAVCIAGTTVAIRVAVFPLFITAQRNQSRMAHMKPELDVVKAQIDRLGPKATQEEQIRYSMKMRDLFRKYECNPLKSLAVPFIQAPVFMSMFFGLRKMPDYFPNELANGGLYWFPDLTNADPLHVLPIASAAMFIGMMEVGKEQMLAGNPQQGPLMLNAFRGLGLIMIPITWNFTSAIFCYWCTNNLVSFGQSVLFKNPAMRKTLGIWDPPPPVPGMQDKPLMEQIKAQFEKSPEEKEAEKIRLHNEAIERRRSPPAERRAGRGRKKRGGS